MFLETDDIYSVVRGCNVFFTLCAFVLTSLGCFAPLFRLSVPSLHLAMEQNLWTTSIYSYSSKEINTPAVQFWECASLVQAFRVMQVCSVVSIIAGVAVFALGIVHLITMFSVTYNYPVRAKLAVPILTISCFAAATQYAVLCIARSTYSSEWCVGASQYLSRGATITKTSSSTSSGNNMLPNSNAAPLAGNPSSSKEGCSPFNGCVTSFDAMKFRRSPGFYLVKFAFYAHMGSSAVALVMLVATLPSIMTPDPEAEAAERRLVARQARFAATLASSDGNDNNRKCDGNANEGVSSARSSVAGTKPAERHARAARHHRQHRRRQQQGQGEGGVATEVAIAATKQ